MNKHELLEQYNKSYTEEEYYEDCGFHFLEITEAEYYEYGGT